jgi:transcriptional regulator of aromatic amino acid metabolism
MKETKVILEYLPDTVFTVERQDALTLSDSAHAVVSFQHNNSLYAARVPEYIENNILDKKINTVRFSDRELVIGALFSYSTFINLKKPASFKAG